jgi:phosphate:Na+ symporter
VAGRTPRTAPMTVIHRCLAALLLLSSVPGMRAQSAPLLASGESAASHEAITLIPYEYLDENGKRIDASGDRTIWTTLLPEQWATLRVQVCSAEAAMPEHAPGEMTRRAGVPEVRISVEVLGSDFRRAPDVEVEPARENSDWRTDEFGVFSLRVAVPRHEGEHYFIFTAEDDAIHTLALSISVKSPNWILWLALGLVGGLALLLTGMTIGSEGLQGAAGAKFREKLHSLTRSPVRGVMAGMVATFFTQSSTATTVMLVGFVRAGLMTLRQSLGPIFGAAIGTTITVQLIAFNVQAYSLAMMAVGFTLSFLVRSPKVAAAGKILFGFGMIFFGMKIMGDVITPLKASPGFHAVLAGLTTRPLWCLIVTAIFTALVHSSGATLGIALTLANQGLLTIDQSLWIIYGANIGTTITAILASIGGSTEAKRVALAHLLFKLGAVALFSFWFMPDLLAWMAVKVSQGMAAALPGVPLLANTTARQMANADTVLCVISTFLALAFGRGALERTVVWLVPPGEDEKKEARAKYLDLALLESPQLALGAATREISRMARFVEEMAKGSLKALETRDPETVQWLARRDDKVDRAFDRINSFLTQLTGKSGTPQEMDRAIGLLYVINDLESIGDLVVKILLPLVNKMIDMDIHLSEEGMEDVRQLHQLVNDSLSKTILALTTPGEAELFHEVVQRQEEMQVTGRRLHLRHLKRLREGQHETIDTSSVHLDLINYLLRMHYHIFSIAWTVSRGVSTHDDMP